MGKNYFTEDQQIELRKNPYIQKVSAKSITYTKEFKEKFEEEYRMGKLPSEILFNMGIDPRILGKRRKDSIVSRIKLYELMIPEKIALDAHLQSTSPMLKELSA